MAKTTIYFVSDLHGSNVCFRKFINAAPIYGANVLVLGADLAGKAIQQIVRQPGGRWRPGSPAWSAPSRTARSWPRWRSSSPTTATTPTGPSPVSWRRWRPRERWTRCS